MYRLTRKGLAECERFIAECEAKRKEILDAGKDTADDTIIPTIEDIECDINDCIDKDGEYYNSWGVTDNYNSDTPLCLTLNEDFVRVGVILI